MRSFLPCFKRGGGAELATQPTWHSGLTCALHRSLSQAELVENVWPLLHIRELVLLACTSRQLRSLLKDDSIWRGSLSSCVDIAFDLSLSQDDGLTWRCMASHVHAYICMYMCTNTCINPPTHTPRCLAMHVLEGLGSLRIPGAEVTFSSLAPCFPLRALFCCVLRAIRGCNACCLQGLTSALVHAQYRKVLRDRGVSHVLQ